MQVADFVLYRDNHILISRFLRIFSALNMPSSLWSTKHVLVVMLLIVNFRIFYMYYKKNLD